MIKLQLLTSRDENNQRTRLPNNDSHPNQRSPYYILYLLFSLIKAGRSCLSYGNDPETHARTVIPNVPHPLPETNITDDLL